MIEEVPLSAFSIRPGATYVYTGEKPDGCAGHHYKVHKIVLYVPVYSKLVLVEALSGQDKGLWFVCSPANFATRYKLLEGENHAETTNKGNGPEGETK